MNLEGVTNVIERPGHFEVHRGMKGVHKVPFHVLGSPEAVDKLRAVAKGYAHAAKAIATQADSEGVTHAAHGAVDQTPAELAIDAAYNNPSNNLGVSRVPPPDMLASNTPIVPSGSAANVLGRGGEQDLASFPPGTEQSVIDAAKAKIVAEHPGTVVDSSEAYITPEARQASRLRYPAETSAVTPWDPAAVATSGDVTAPGDRKNPTYFQPAGVKSFPSGDDGSNHLSDSGIHTGPPLQNPVPANAGGTTVPAPASTPELQLQHSPGFSLVGPMGVPSDKAFQDALAAAQRQAAMAEHEKATNLEANAASQIDVQKQIDAHRAQTLAAIDSKVQENQANAKATEDWIKDPGNQVDPNRLFHQAGVGGMIVSAIGSFLGGIGGGLTHSPNEFWAVMNPMLERDVKAQENARAGEATLLGYYRKQGYDIQNSRKLALATEQTYANGLLASNALKFVGDSTDANGASIPGSAGAQARAAIAAGQMQAAKLGFEATSDSFKLKNLAQTTANSQNLVRLTAQRNQILEKGQQDTANNADVIRKIMNPPNARQAGFPLPAGGSEALPSEIRKRLVPLDNGNFTTVRDEKDQPEVKTAMALIRSISAKTKRYEALRAENPTGNWQSITPAGSTFRTTAKALRSEILSDTGHLHDLKRLSEVDLDLYKAGLPDITEVGTGAANKAGVDTFTQSITDASKAIRNTYLDLDPL